eukprot:145019_1
MCLDEECGVVPGEHFSGSTMRMAKYTEHKAYQMSPVPNDLRRISAGPILSEDGKHMEGSLFIFEGDAKETVLNYIHEDPFFKCRVWKSVKCKKFLNVFSGDALISKMNE